jgi:hypothetical protein
MRCGPSKEKDRVASFAASAQLRETGVALLREFFPKAALTRLREAAVGCFQATCIGGSIPERYRFNPLSNSVLLTALLEFGCESNDELLAPLSSPDLAALFTEAMKHPWRCNLEQSWVRKKFAPAHAPDSGYHQQNWHQDGALGARFPLQLGPAIPMTELLTCWIPLQHCGTDSPGLEFVRRRQRTLLHFTELDDTALRGRFGEDQFWAPPLDFGDGLIFLNDVLHRTHVRPEMQTDRLSVEYRIFPQENTFPQEADSG